MEVVKTADLYEASYYLLNDCKIQAINPLQINGKISCEIGFSGEKLSALQFAYFKGEAVVNLFAFRRTYTQINGYVSQAKKEYKRQSGGGE